MNIAIIAHNSKKELVTSLCSAYSSILCRHNLIATASTANVLRQATGLEVRGVLAGSMGGGEQIGSMIACGEVDMVLLFNNYTERNYDGHYILHLCDTYMVPAATNLAAAELLIRSLGRGELDWRKVEMEDDSSAKIQVG